MGSDTGCLCEGVEGSSQVRKSFEVFHLDVSDFAQCGDDWKRKKKIESEGELDDSIFSADRIDPSAKTAPSMPGRPDKEIEKAELRLAIENALSKLSDNHREVIILREVQGLDYKEIAEIVGCSLGTVMSRLFNARKKPKTLLSK